VAKWVVCAARVGSGVRHRVAMLSAIKCFADCYGYSVWMLWGVTKGVAFCRFEDLFAPIPRVRVTNISPDQLSEAEHCARRGQDVRVGERSFSCFRPGDTPKGSLFSWDLIASGALARLASPSWRQVVVQPAATIRAHTRAYARAHQIDRRLGIRVRVEEGTSAKRKPRRIIQDLNETVKSIITIPWYAKVFLATDSEYIQQMLALHFHDARFLPRSSTFSNLAAVMCTARTRKPCSRS